jgi:hypothetical protein
MIFLKLKGIVKKCNHKMGFESNSKKRFGIVSMYGMIGKR